MADRNDFPLLAEFRHALADCRKLYLDAGRKIVEEHPNLIRGEPGAFVQKMDNLHKALLVKVYIMICEADRRWSVNEQLLAEVLFQHVWNRHLEGDTLREAVREIARKSSTLKWYSLVRPFDQVAPLREFVGRLETVVTRVANLVARADGKPQPNELAHIKHLQNELATHLRQIPIDEPSEHAAADELGGQAIAQVDRDAGRVQTQCELEEQPATVEEQKSQEERLKEALDELDALIGLDTVKREVRTLINFLKIQRERVRAGLPETALSLHMVFNGNPGTGKTTVARIVGKIFGAIGILEKGHVVETDRSGLVAEYAGQTGPKANKKIDEAKDGVLFIDEAYSLIAAEGEDPFGNEAVQALLKRMEDDRDQLVVILAGYPHEMRTLLGSNPGLSSRFSRHLHFVDYAPRELCRIFQKMCTANEYDLRRIVRVKLMLGFDWLHRNRDRHFGNGRTVRNVFEQAIRRLANRIAMVEELTKEHLTVLRPDDIEFAGPAIRGLGQRAKSEPRAAGPIDPLQQALSTLAGGGDAAAGARVESTDASDLEKLLVELEDDARHFAIACPKCGNTRDVPQTYLCRRLVCKKCGDRFTAEWGEVAS